MDAPRTVKVAANSGAGDHVAAAELVGMHLVVPSPGSRNGCHFVSASGDRMKNRGEAKLKLNDPRAGTILTSTFQVADVTRPLHSTAVICDEDKEMLYMKGEAVVVPEGTFSRFLGSVKPIMRYKRDGNLYTAKFRVRDPRAVARTVKPKSGRPPRPAGKPGFGGQGSRR